MPANGAMPTSSAANTRTRVVYARGRAAGREEVLLTVSSVIDGRARELRGLRRSDPLSLAVAHAKAATGVVPAERAGTREREARPTLQATGVLDGDGTVWRLGEDVCWTRADQELPDAGCPHELLINLDV